jgi:membrane protease YdiL (CAAX protease family)
MKLESTSRLRDRFAVFALLCFLAFVGITYVRHEFGANQWWNEPARDLALGLVPLGISIILWEYFLRKARHDEIIEYVNNELTNALSARLSKLD